MLARTMAVCWDLNFEDEHLILKDKRVEGLCEIYNGKNVVGSTCSLHAHVNKTFKMKIIVKGVVA